MLCCGWKNKLALDKSGNKIIIFLEFSWPFGWWENFGIVWFLRIWGVRKFNKLIDRVGLIIVKILLVHQLKLIVEAEKLFGSWFLNIYLEYCWVLSFGFAICFNRETVWFVSMHFLLVHVHIWISFHEFSLLEYLGYCV